MGGARANIVKRFYERVALPTGGGCWIWQGARTSGGYGDFVLHDTPERGRRKVLAHRMSLMLSGTNCEEKVVHHKCGQKLCVNPGHLGLMDCYEHFEEHRIWTRETVVEAILRFVAQHGVFPAATDWNISQARSLGHLMRVRRYEQGHWPSTQTVQTVFGSWNNALLAAGCDHAGHGRRKREFELDTSAV